MNVLFPNQDEQIKGDYFSPEFSSELKRFFSKGNRRTGRTTLLTRILVEIAIETGDKINLVDNNSIFSNDRRMILEIERYCIRYIQALEQLGIKFIKKDIFTSIGKLQIEIHPDSLSLYLSLRIKDSLNVFPVQKIKERIEEQNNEFYKLLLII